MAVGVDGQDAVGDQLGADAVGEVGQRMAARVVGGERLGGPQRAQLEVRLGRDERQPDARAGEVVQRERELDGCDAAAGDDDVGWGRVVLCMGSYGG